MTCKEWVKDARSLIEDMLFIEENLKRVYRVFKDGDDPICDIEVELPHVFTEVLDQVLEASFYLTDRPDKISDRRSLE